MTFVSTRGRPPRGTTLRDLATSGDRILQRVELMDTAYREAIAGNVRWAMFIAQVSGELAQVQVNLPADSPVVLAFNNLRAALGLPELGAQPAGDVVDAESRVVSEDPPAQ